MLVDSHCHLDLMDLAPYNGDVGAVIAEAKQNEVHTLLSVSVNLERFEHLLQHALDYPDNVYISVGMHPNESPGAACSVEQLLTLAKHNKVIAIGETGLDFYRSDKNNDWQVARMRAHITAAKQLGKPLIIHTRAARDETLAVLQEEQAGDVGGVMHCFTEDWQMAKQCIDMGFYISMSGIVTFKNASDLQAVARQIPLDRLLIETDSPYLAPVPMRGKPNSPAYVRHVADFIADLRGESFATISAATTANFQRCFNL